ncbi:MAG: hypothetical protein WD249_05885 [Gaiellaceae bacterium]
MLLHYAPIEETVQDEPLGIRVFLGSSRLAIAEYPPDLVVHGHAHLGRFEGRIGRRPRLQRRRARDRARLLDLRPGGGRPRAH